MEPDNDIRKWVDFIGEELTIPQSRGSRDLLADLTVVIKAMLDKDLEKLASLLYRLDVDEVKLKKAVAAKPPQEAAETIARLIIERQEEKRKTRQNFYRADDIPEEDKW